MSNTKKTGQKQLDELRVLLKAEEISEYAGNKEAFKSASKSFLSQLLRDLRTKLELRGDVVVKSRYNFNPGGPAVPGDPSLYIMARSKGVAIYISQGHTNQPEILYRNVKSMTDYSGQGNHWIPVTQPYLTILSAVAGML